MGSAGPVLKMEEAIWICPMQSTRQRLPKRESGHHGIVIATPDRQQEILLLLIIINEKRKPISSVERIAAGFIE